MGLHMFHDQKLIKTRHILKLNLYYIRKLSYPPRRGLSAAISTSWGSLWVSPLWHAVLETYDQPHPAIYTSLCGTARGSPCLYFCINYTQCLILFFHKLFIDTIQVGYIIQEETSFVCAHTDMKGRDEKGPFAVNTASIDFVRWPRSLSQPKW